MKIIFVVVRGIFTIATCLFAGAFLIGTALGLASKLLRLIFGVI